MLHGVIEESQWRALREASSESAGIVVKANALIERLSQAVQLDGGYREMGFEINSTGSGCANITSPLGRGRIRLEYFVKDDDLVGRLVIERIDSDIENRLSAKPVWAIWLPQRGEPITADGQGPTVAMTRTLKDDRKHTAYVAGMSIFYAIMAGPHSEMPDVVESAEPS